jgi:6-phosphogluconolactonase
LLTSSLMAGLSIANEDNDPIVTFRIDRQTGMLSLEGEAIRTGSPVCIIFGVA